MAEHHPILAQPTRIRPVLRSAACGCLALFGVALVPSVATAGPLQALFELLESRLDSAPEQPSCLRVDGTEGPNRRERAPIAVAPDDPESWSGLPKLLLMPSSELQADWADLKRSMPFGKQLKAVERRGLFARAADDLVAVNQLRTAFETNLRRRDRWRDRIWATPELFAVLDQASRLMAQRLPGKWVTVGDLAQDGGGQIAWGVKTALLRDDGLRDPVSQFLADAERWPSRFVRQRIVDPLHVFPNERVRFEAIDGPILVEESLVALRHSPASADRDDLIAKMETRRFYDGEIRQVEDLEKWFKGLKRKLRRASKVRSETVHIDGRKAYRTAWVKGRTITELITDTSFKKWPRLVDVAQVRTGQLNAKKPGVWAKERRWVREPDSPTWRRWKMLYEATHISHTAGLDADLSYITYDNTDHFSREVSQIDPEATRQWLSILVEASQTVGVEIDKLLIDRKVIKRLEADLDPKTERAPFWEFVSPASGHDSHVHVRLKRGFLPVSRAKERPSPEAVPATPASLESE